jgi:Domain of unknown function (DUF4148)
MNSKLLVGALIVASGLVGISSVAEEMSGKTRAQVRAERAAAQKDGSSPMYVGEEPVGINKATTSKSRQQVKNEAINAQKNGTSPMYHGEEPSDDAKFNAALKREGELNLPPTAAGPRTRQSVKDEMLRANRDGSYPKLPDTGQ